MTAPNLPLTAEDLDHIKGLIARGSYDVLTWIVDLEKQARAALDLAAQVSQAPDPHALPLSTAMREARARTEAGEETWFSVQDDEPLIFALRPARGRGIEWHYALRAHIDRGVEWNTTPFMGWIEAEKFVCRLVSPDEGAAILRGGE